MAAKRISKIFRYAAAMLCAAFLLTTAACTPAGNQSSSSAPAATSVNQSSAQLSGDFVSRLTKNGTGLVRDVGPTAFTHTSLSDWNGLYDIRWLDCPKYVNADNTKKLLDTAPNINFNTDTVWPASLPSGFDPAAILEAGKNPGLGVRGLHAQGITGKGISIAIMDMTLFTGHPEYKDNLALYEEIHVIPGEPAVMHGSAVSSIAVGKTCGVAPDAKLYYWAVNLSKAYGSMSPDDKNIAFAEALAVAIDRMLEINAKLPESEKIKVLSISRGFDDLSDEGVQTFLKAVERAKEAGIFVITTSTSQYCDFMTRETDFAGLGKTNMAGNPDDLSTYTLGSWELSAAARIVNNLLVPMDGRTTADFTGAEDYVFYAQGGFSWVAPYLAGVYALACQVKPDITPAVFWQTALDTASQLTVPIGGTDYTFNHVLNPPALINALR